MTSPLCSAREALEPFAEAAAHLHPSHPDDGLTLDCIPVRAWRKAAEVYAALASSPPAETEEGVREALEKLQRVAEKMERSNTGLWDEEIAAIRTVVAALSRGEAAERPLFCHKDEDPAEFNALVRANGLVNDLLLAIERGDITRDAVLANFDIHIAVDDIRDLSRLFNRHSSEMDDNRAWRINEWLKAHLSGAPTPSHHPEAGAPSREAIAAFLKSRDEALGPVGPEHTDEERLESADAILSLFSPQSLKASAKRGLSIANDEEADVRGPDSNNALPGKIGPRAVPLSTISEGWRPIETAPKDGTEILTFRRAGLISVAAWFAASPGITAASFSGEWCVTDGACVLNVTHWMPLPAPPALSEGGPDDRSDDQAA